MNEKEVLTFAIIGFISLCCVAGGMLFSSLSYLSLVIISILAVSYLLALQMLYHFYKEKNAP